jgi:hypothetical protein
MERWFGRDSSSRWDAWSAVGMVFLALGLLATANGLLVGIVVAVAGSLILLRVWRERRSSPG